MKRLLARPDEVRAFMSGKKTMLRRPIKMRDIDFIGGRGQENDPECWGYDFDGPNGHGWMVLAQGLYETHNGGMRSIPSPYAPGDTVAVKETWAYCDQAPGGVVYRDPPNWGPSDVSPVERWRSPVCMPPDAVRLHLLVKAVKVERLQDISINDACADGLAGCETGRTPATIRNEFAQHWDSHAKPGERWADSPWVVAYTVEVKHV